MEWIRISKNKLKIMLSAEDARHYELDCEAADLGELVTRTAFHEILSDVKMQTDFDASEDKIYIQMYPSKGGGCELFVTKMGLLLSDEEKEISPQTVREKGRFCLPPRTAKPFAAREKSPVMGLAPACMPCSSVISSPSPSFSSMPSKPVSEGLK